MTAVVQDLSRVAVEMGVTVAELKGSEDVRGAVAAAAGISAPVRTEQWRSVIPKVDDAARAAATRHHGSSCTRCGAPVIWGTTEAGKTMPVDPLPCPGGNVIRMPQGRQMVLRVLAGHDLPVTGRSAYRSLFATCPNADELRGRRSARQRRADDQGKVARCRVCSTPMDPWLPEQGYSTHPMCDPTDQGSES